MEGKYAAGRIGATNAGFPTSCWTMVLSLRKDDDESAKRDALASLFEIYWFPLYAFARHRGMARHDAEDAVQSFFLSISDISYFQKADQNLGKLRTFILTGFTRHMKDLKVRANALKRGGGAPHVSIDTDQAEEWLLRDPNSEVESADRKFEQHWARNIIRTVTEVLRREAGNSPEANHRFEVLSRFLNPESCHNFSVQEAADELKMKKPACEKAVQRLRHSFRLAVREQVAATLHQPTPEDILEEMKHLQKALATPSS